MNELALFAGAGGGILGGKLLGWTTVCAVEFDAFAAALFALALQLIGLNPVAGPLLAFGLFMVLAASRLATSHQIQ